MSSIRTKRKHVLDSDSEEDASPPPVVAEAVVAPVAPAKAVVDLTEEDDARSSPVARAGRRRLASAAAVEARAAAHAARVGVVDLADDAPAADAAVVALASSASDDDSDDARSGSAPDEALERCAKISRRLRRALGQDVGDRDGPLSPGGRSGRGAAAAKRQLVTAADVALIAGEGSSAPRLKPYQLIGINFLLLLDEQEVPGAILADEMGLGKTAQTIAYLACSRHRKARGVGGWHPGTCGGGDASGWGEETHSREPALVVAPASLLENWRRELARWAPSLRVGFYHGQASQAEVRAAADAWARARGLGASGGGGAFDVVIACYSLFERDAADQKEKRRWLRSLTYSHLVLDEAHLVKNRATQRAKRLDAVAAKARRRVLLTGTPLQNNLLELEALIHLVLPGLLAEGGLGGGGGGGGDDERGGGGGGAGGGSGSGGGEGSSFDDDRRVRRVKAILAPFILRRLKEEVATELVPKRKVKIVARMTDGQRATYERAVECARAERRREREKNLSSSSSDENGGAGNSSSSQKVKALFTHLRKIANHPLLVRDRYGDQELAFVADVCHRRGVFGHEAGLEKVRKHLEGMSDFDLHDLCEDERVRGALDSKRLPPEALEDAGKTRELLRLLREIKKRGSRPLVFSQWKIVLDVLERVLRKNGHAFVRLDGATAVEERQRICDAFNDDASGSFAFLLSTRAGGQGLNLTGADAVVIHDCDFNPQIDRQAEDRCHRLGQKKPVTVYRLVAEATVDERIVEVAEEKLHLDKRVLQRRKSDGGVEEKEHKNSERALGDAGDDDALGGDDAFGGGDSFGDGDGDGDVAAREARAMHSIIEDLLGGGR